MFLNSFRLTISYYEYLQLQCDLWTHFFVHSNLPVVCVDNAWRDVPLAITDIPTCSMVVY